MFIKKDLRKIDEILNDPADSRERMLLPKRASELRGSVKVLCKESNTKKLANLKVLNLYENDLSSLKGIGLLANCPLEDLNLGSNKLSSLPVEFGTLSTLRNLWLEDNLFDSFPVSLCSITGLEVRPSACLFACLFACCVVSHLLLRSRLTMSCLHLPPPIPIHANMHTHTHT